MKPRDYKKEYRTYQGTPEQIHNRALRNKARGLMIKQGMASKGDGKEVDHKHPLSKGGGNRLSNLRVVSRHTNRTKGSKA